MFAPALMNQLDMIGGMASAKSSVAARVGSYEVLRELAAGGMAELFLARSVGPEGFQKLVALKKILPEFADKPRFVRLFLDEAKLVASLDHPNIAQVYDMGTVDGDYFFTMEFVHGQDVRSILKTAEGPLPIDLVIQVARSIAGALHYAHGRRGHNGASLGIVHRDVSPSNILISYEGAIKLVDFGVAKAATSTVKTRTGALKGKVAYMSPEQCKGLDLDRRSDVFSLGVVLWEMATSKRLFKGNNDLATLQQVINHDVPAPSSIASEVHPELDRIIMRALEKSPEDRYQTAQQLQIDLEEHASENKVKLSSVALSSYLRTQFAKEMEAWKRAQSEGATLADHLAATGGETTLTTPRRNDNEVELESPDDVPPGVEISSVRLRSRSAPVWLWLAGAAAIVLGLAAVAVTVSDGNGAAERGAVAQPVREPDDPVPTIERPDGAVAQGAPANTLEQPPTTADSPASTKPEPDKKPTAAKRQTGRSRFGFTDCPHG